MNTYFLHDGRNEVGPFTIDSLKKQKLTRNTPIRLDGKNNWSPAEKINELKEQVAPRKIKRPKDIVPVMIELAVDFKERRPKTAYAILFCMAMLAGLSIYSIDKRINRDLPKENVFSSSAPALQTTIAAADTGIAEKKEAVIEAPKEDKEKASRLRWNKLFSAANSNYGIGFLGGIKDLKVVVTNRSDYPVDEAVAKVTYIKASGEIWKTKLVTIYGVPAHDSKEQTVPDVNRGKKVTVTIQKIVSKKMKFSYAVGKKTGNAEDPYLMQ